jgi:hypothetical protein
MWLYAFLILIAGLGLLGAYRYANPRRCVTCGAPIQSTKLGWLHQRGYYPADRHKAFDASEVDMDMVLEALDPVLSLEIVAELERKFHRGKLNWRTLTRVLDRHQVARPFVIKT